MTPLAIAFAWAWGLPDWRTAEALGVSENTVRRQRKALGLRKTGRGMPAWRDRGEAGTTNVSAGATAGNERTIEKAAAVRTRDGLKRLDWTGTCYLTGLRSARRTSACVAISPFTQG